MRLLLPLFLALFGALSAAPQHTVLLKESAAAGKAGDTATALAKLEEAAKLRPDYPRIQLNLARAYAAQNRPDDALAALDRLAAMGLSLNIAGDPALTSVSEIPRFQTTAARLTANATQLSGELSAMHLPGVTGILESCLYDPVADEWYFSDVRNRCIWKRGVAGRLLQVTRDEEKLDGVFKLLLTPDRQTLWAGTASIGVMTGANNDEGARSTLIAFDFASGHILGRYPVPADGRKHLLGDFILAADGALYATDSFSPVIWRLPPGGKQLEAWLESEDFLNLQGLAFSADGQSLFVADYSNGVWCIDVATKSAALLVAPPEATFFGIDGLYAVKGGLLAVQNGINPQRVLRIEPKEGSTPSPTRAVAGGYPAMTDLSLGTVAGGRFHFIADSGWALFDPMPAKLPPARKVTVYSFKIE